MASPLLETLQESVTIIMYQILNIPAEDENQLSKDGRHGECILNCLLISSGSFNKRNENLWTNLMILYNEFSLFISYLLVIQLSFIF